MRIEEAIKQPSFKSEFQKASINVAYTGSWNIARQTKYLKQFDVSPQQMNILRILKGQHPNPVPLNLLTDRMIDKMSNTSRLVEKLRVKGYVERSICSQNRRQVDIVFTEKGLEFINDLSEKMENEFSKLQTITNEECKLLSNLLDKYRG